MSISDHKIQNFAGDLPNINGVEQYLDKAFHACQQMDSRLWNLFPFKSMSQSDRTLWIPMIDKLDGTTGRMDTMTSGIVSNPMASTGAALAALGHASKYYFTQNMVPGNKKRLLYANAPEVAAPLIALTDMNSNAWIDAMSQYLRGLEYAWNRFRDSAIVTMLGATTVIEGTDHTTTGAVPTSTETYLDTYSVLGGGDTIADWKLIEQLTKEFEDRDVNVVTETPILIGPPRLKQHLRASKVLINQDYTTRNVVDSNDLQEVEGYRLRIVSNDIISASAGTIRCYAVIPSGCMTAEWGTMYSSMSVRHDRYDALQTLQMYISGAVRVLDASVIWFDIKDVDPTY